MKPFITVLAVKGLMNKYILFSVLLLVHTVATANNGGRGTVPEKHSVPVNYYEGFMITVAIVYSIYLIIRARRRKKANKVLR